MNLLPQRPCGIMGLRCPLHGLHPVEPSGARCGNAVGWVRAVWSPMGRLGARSGGAEMGRSV